MSDELPAGRELDAIVAVACGLGKPEIRQFAWSNTTVDDWVLIKDGDMLRCPQFSIQIMDAFWLFNHFTCHRSLRCDAEGIWWAEYNIDGTRYVGRGETAELAICRGALLAKEKTE